MRPARVARVNKPTHCGWYWVRWRVWPEGPQEQFEAVLVVDQSFAEDPPAAMYALRAGQDKPLPVLDGRGAEWIELVAPSLLSRSFIG